MEHNLPIYLLYSFKEVVIVINYTRFQLTFTIPLVILMATLLVVAAQTD